MIWDLLFLREQTQKQKNIFLPHIKYFLSIGKAF